MEIATGTASNVVTGVVGSVVQQIKCCFSNVRNYRKAVSDFEDKVETLKGKRDRLLLDVDAAEKNGDGIYPDIKSWLIKADDVVNSKYNQVKGLEDGASNKCFVGLCPNCKDRYQLSRKAKEEASAVDELLRSGGFERISYPGVPRSIVDLSPKDFEDFDSRKQSFNNIMEAVKDPNVNIVGVHGMSGVGKTTLVKEVMRQVKADKVFDSVVFAVLTHTPDIQKIQDQIADMLGLKLEEQSASGRASRLCQRLEKEKNILVVLDDIWERLDLMEVGIPSGEEHQGCTILLTSRDLRVLSKAMDARICFPVGVLEDKEAWALFKKVAGDGVESRDLFPIATKVAKKCGGLPIAIKTLASSLRDAPLFEWEDALRQLNRPSSSNLSGIAQDAYLAIKLSYDRLQSEEHKQIFLLCSLLGHNAQLDVLLMCSIGLGLFHGVNTIDETRNRLLTVVSHLKASCLLLDGNSDHRFDMHDLICDVAVSIASEGNRVFVLKGGDVLNVWPDDETMKECDKISLWHASISKLPDQLKCSKLTFFRMGSKDPWEKIPATFFKELENLKLLSLSDMSFPSLPSSISLLANLRTLCLTRCVLGDISLVGKLKNLEILCLADSDIETLPEEIRQLTKLKCLDLSDCSQLERIPSGVLCKLTRLEELYMGNSFVEWGAEGNSSLAELELLSSLTALEIHIPNSNIIPKGFFFERLQRYTISIGEAYGWDWNWKWKWEWVGEYSRTLRLSIQTSISFLNYGFKVLMKKAENLYIDEVKGVEILSHDEFRDCFQQLKNLHIENGGMIRYIIKDNDDVRRIEFLQLKSLTLKGLPNLISFCSGNNGSTSISPQPQETTLFNRKTSFPKLEKLKLSSISIERIWVPQAFHSTQNLTSLIVEDCDNLKHVLFDSMAEYLQQLECLEISKCKCMREIISMDETSQSRALPICFPRLNSLKLKGLKKLIGFCHEAYTVEFPALMEIEIENCPELEGFMHKSLSKDIPTDGVLFNEMVAFPNLRKIKVFLLRNVKRIWYNQLHVDSFSKLKELRVEYCDGLLNIFPLLLLPVFQGLEILTVTGCTSLEEVFQLQVHGSDIIEENNVVSSQLREVNLIDLSKLKHVWNERTPKTSWPALKKLSTCGCGKIKLFGHVESQFIEQVIPQLEQVSFGVGDIAMINDHQFEPDFFCHIRHLQINGRFDETNDVPFCFVQRFYNLETLEVRSCHFKELSPSEGDAGEDHISASLESLQVWDCHSLINLGSYFSTLQNLTTLYVWKCKGMTELITSSKAQSLACLVTMSIGYCETMREVVASQGDQTTYEIVFEKLKSLQLYNLPSLKSFCLGNHTFRFPSLEWVTVSQCPRINNFCQGVLSTPKLQKVQFTRTDFKGRWAGDLNATVEQLYIEQVGYRDLGRLEFSVFPELADIWSRNPQEVLDLKSVEYLEVCDSDNLRCIFNLSIALSMGRLHRLEIKRCRNLEQVIKEEDSNTVAEGAIVIIDGNKIISIFPHLRSIKLESCSNMTSFYLGSTTLECSSLKEIVVADCPNMTTFVSTFSKKGNEEAIIDDEADTFFSHKVGFPNLEIMEVSHLRNVKRIWNNQVHAGSFPNLKGLEVAYCDGLLNIFPFHLQKVFHGLEILRVTDCASLEQVFQLQVNASENNVVSSQLREVNLIRLPKLKHVWNMDFSFENLREVFVSECQSLKTLFPFSIAKRLLQLESLIVENCGVEEIVSKIDGGVEHEIQFEFNQCEKIKIFGHVQSQFPKPLFIIEQVIPQLEQVSFDVGDIAMINDHQFESDFFSNIRHVHITCDSDETNVFPFCFLQRFYNLETLEVVGSCNSKELSPYKGDAGEDKDVIATLPKLKKLKLDYVNNTRLLWTQEDHISTSLENLQVWHCHSLINLGSYFSTLQNLTTLDIWDCKEMTEMITSCQAQSLVCLVRMRIRECERMREVIASQGGETTDEIVFEKLKFLELDCLISLESFCSGNHTFRFPSLARVTVSQCPRINNFCQGVLSTPKLQNVWLTKTDFKGRWAGDLNTTVEQLYKEQVGYRGLKHLKFSVFPELVDIWSQNPQEMLDLKSVELLEVCDLDNLRCIFNLSVALSLGRLRQLEIKGCSHLEQVIKEEDSDTVAEEAIITNGNKIIIIFPRLQTIELESCSNMTSFYLGSTALECPSLKEITVAECPNMTTFVSTFSRNGNEGAIIGDEVDTFFSDKVAFPNLEKMKVSHLRNVKRIWYDQLHADSFSKLKELKVECCDALLNIFPYLELQLFQSQLREVNLICLPKLKHIWNKDHNRSFSFGNLQKAFVWECWCLKTLFPFSIAKDLQQLESLIVENCGVEEIVSKNSDGVEQEIRFEFNQLSFIRLLNLPNLKCFFPGTPRIVLPVLKRLSTYCCGKTEIFGHAVPVEKGKSTLPPVALEKASGIQEEFQVHNYTRRPILPLGPKAVRWRHPSLQLLKLNVHGAFQIEDRCGAVGFIVRDVVGSVLGGGAYFIREAYSADFVEAQAVIHALWFVCSKGFKRVIIECDAPAVTSKLKNKFADFSMLGLILEEAKQLMNLFEDVQVRYINKLGNRVAHALAYFGFDCNGPFTFDSNYPDCISELVREDTT
ncbi:hypothetical protein V6N12_057569 [Hibiscus sabdariffa]|uniref:AAA+ ATPase domain-containing protein n=1 Tax=Hibiscus sabdariffa TaxID=183260 RepID=A0ABR2C5H6_9ROSI